MAAQTNPIILEAVSPLSIDAPVWRFQGRIHVTVIAKATFALVPGPEMALVAPAELVRAELHHQNVPTRSVRATSDLSPHLPRADVILTGHACAPHGKPSKMIPVRLAVLRDRPLLDKTLFVVGDRDAAGEPARFEKIPLMYERSYGGIGWDQNPLGVGVKPGKLPNVVDTSDATRTAGFGPISRTWPERRRLLGKADRKALDQPIAEIPDDFDWSYFNAAPADQRIEFFQGDEWIAIDGISADHRHIKVRLPGARAGARVFGITAEPRVISLHGDTLLIDGDALRCSMLFRSSFILPDESALSFLRIAVGLSVGGQPIAWPDRPPQGKKEDTTEELSESDLEDESDRAATVAIAPQVQAPAAPSAERTTWLSHDQLELASLPFRAGDAVLPPPSSPAESKFSGTVALSPEDFAQPAPTSAPLPFGRPTEATIFLDDQQEDDDAPKFAGTVALTPEQAAAAARKPDVPFSGKAPSQSTPSVGASLPGTPWSGVASKAPAPPIQDDHTMEVRSVGERAMKDVSPWARSGQPAGSAFTPSAQPVQPAPQPISPAPAAPAPPPSAPRVEQKREIRAADLPERKADVIPTVPKYGPFYAFTLAWETEPGKHARTIVVKATFSLTTDGAVTLRDDSDPPSGDVHDSGDLYKSVYYPSDFALLKPRADITLRGQAWAPRGSSPAAEVRMRFGRRGNGFDRKIAVFGERRWEGAGVNLGASEPQRFRSMPLVYERAFGGPSYEKNPIGRGHQGAGLPNLEDPDHLLRAPSDAPEPACFAPVPPLFRSRWAKLGTYDALWHEQRWPNPPADFDWSFHQAAPPKQQLEFLDGDEPFDLVGMHPDTPRIEGRLAGVKPRCFVQRSVPSGGAFGEIALRLDTVHFDLEEMKVTLVWRGLLDVADDRASDVAELFLLRQDKGATPLDLAAARDAYLAERAPLDAVATSPDAPFTAAANDAGGGVKEGQTQEFLAQHLRARLKAAGMLSDFETGAKAPSRPRVDPSSWENEKASFVVDPARQAEVLALVARAGSLEGADLSGADLSAVDLSRRSLSGAIFKDSCLRGALFEGADLREAQLAGADLSSARFDGAKLERADLAGADLRGAHFDGALVDDTNFAGARGDRAVLTAARGERAIFSGGSWAGARFDRAELPDADFTNAEIDDAVFDGAKLTAIRLYDAHGERASFKDADMTGARAEGVNLPSASLAAIVAPSSVWDDAKLDNASFVGAVLREASFNKCSCKKTLFSGAELSASRFERAVAQGASFLKANLMTAQLTAADLSDADLRAANLHAAETLKAKLGGAKLELAIVTGTKLEGSAS